jgi:hypothetical protein
MQQPLFLYVCKEAAMKAFFCGVLIFSGTLLFAQNGQARIINFTGSVEIKAPGRTDWVPAAAGMEIGKDSLVSTGFNSTARIGLGNSVLTVRPLTRLTVAEIAQKGSDETVALYLETGRVRAEVSPPSGGKTNFTVRSPSMTASVRGTAFEFNTRRIQVENGRVLFSSANGQAVYVDGGERSYADEAQNRPVPPFEAETASLTPIQPGLGDTGSTTGTNAPAVSHRAAIGTAFEWP